MSPMRRACRSSPLHGEARKCSTRAVASSTECWRAPIAQTLASLCPRASSAGSRFHPRAAPTPGPFSAATRAGGLLRGVRAGADRADVGVVVPAGELGGLAVPHEGGTHAGHLVGGDLLAVARASDDHAQAPGLDHHPLAHLEAERRVVVLRVV